MVIKSDEILVDLNEIKKKDPSILFNLTNDAEKDMNYILVIMYLHIIKNILMYHNKHQQHLYVID